MFAVAPPGVTEPSSREEPSRLRVKLTGDVKPFTPAAVTAKLRGWPDVTTKGEADEEEGVTVSVKSCAVKAPWVAAMWLKVPLVPITAAAVRLTGEVTVMVDVPEPPETVAELKLTVAPAGRPCAARVTLPMKPLMGATVTV
jgi:hypothetical protein